MRQRVKLINKIHKIFWKIFNMYCPDGNNADTPQLRWLEFTDIYWNVNRYRHINRNIFVATKLQKGELVEQLFKSQKSEIPEIILLGDLNCRTGKKLNNNVIGRYGKETVSANGIGFTNLCEQLRITKGFYQRRWIHKYTWIEENRKLKSYIDIW